MSEIAKNYPREAAKITLAKVTSWEELNAVTAVAGNEKFNEATKKYWSEFAVSGVLNFKDGKQTLQPFTDLDGNSALGLLKMAGMDTSKLGYVKPGEFAAGPLILIPEINLASFMKSQRIPLFLIITPKAQPKLLRPPKLCTRPWLALV